MKKLTLLMISISLCFLCSCDADQDTTKASGKNILQNTRGTYWASYDSIAAETGYIGRWGYPTYYYIVENNITGYYPYNPVYVGRTESSLTNSKAIFSFNTSSLPNNATINAFEIQIMPCDENNSMLLEPGDYTYLENYLKLEVAGPSGFGGNYALTSADYSAASASGLVPLYRAGALYLLFVDPAANAAINKTGKTQFRISFPTNPEPQLKKLFDSGGYGAFRLDVNYTTP